MITSAVNIFDGEFEAEIPLTFNGFSSNYKKMEWGEKVLSDYVAKFHGRRYAIGNGNRNGRLTGIKIIVSVGNKNIVYALIEPTDKSQRKIFITKTETPESEGDIRDLWDFQDKAAQEKPKGVFAEAFSGINLDVKKLPKKTETCIVKINRFKERFGIEPQYPENDPIVGGKSMRMFYPISQRKDLFPGQKWRVAVKGTPFISGTNKLELPIVRVNIEFLEKIE